ncbi:amino acid transporter AVT1E [Selaginella moellendorffii]|nr:amino acid transporter AVT1E [Selaginella moellendorffii]|eukprot:XP_024519013.1 amino acid transporter AVT1E [Selaginella moellendorffii]
MATLLNVIVGIIGSVMFGAQTKAQVHLSMPPNLLASKVAIWATLITPVTQFALFLSPISCELEGVLLPRLPWRSDSRLVHAASMALRTALLLGITLGALVFPYFANIIELIGSSVSVTLCVVFPCVFYVKIFYRSLIQAQQRWRLVGIVGIVVVSALAGVAGTVVSIQDLARKKN